MSGVSIEELLEKTGILLKAGKTGEANILFQKVLEQAPESPAVSLQITLLSLQLKNFDVAVKYGNQVLKNNPKSVEALLALGNAYLIQKCPSEALGYFQNVIALAPRNPAGYFNAGKCQNLLGKYKEALRLLEQASSVSPDSSEIFNEIGRAYEGTGDVEMALGQYRRSMALWQGASAIVYDYSRCLVAFEDFKGVSAYAKSVRKIACLNAEQVEGLNIVELIAEFLSGDAKSSQGVVDRIGEIKASPGVYPDMELLRYYYGCIKAALVFRSHHESLYAEGKKVGQANDAPPLFVVGDANCLPQAFMRIMVEGRNFKCIPKLTMGIQARFLAEPAGNKYKSYFRMSVMKVPKRSSAVFMCGQEDCSNAAEGIFRRHKKEGVLQWDVIESEIKRIVEGYVSYGLSVAKERELNVAFYGVPAPSIEPDNCNEEEAAIFRRIVRYFNECLAASVKGGGATFVDIYKITVDSEGAAVKKYYMNNLCLRPDVFLGASQMLEV